jgi:hypothetical protein
VHKKPEQKACAAMTVLAMLLLAMAGCGDDDMDASNLPPAAVTLRTGLKDNLVDVIPLAGRLQSSLIFVFNPGSGLGQGVAMTPDISAGAPAHAFNIDGDFDVDGDGLRETHMTGHAVFAANPASAWSSVSGDLVIDIDYPVVGEVYHATVNYTLSSQESTLSGSGTLTNPLTGTTTTMTVPANQPLVFKPANGATHAVANACGFSVAGSAAAVRTSTLGRLQATVAFTATNPLVALQAVSFTDNTGLIAKLPDSTTSLGCGDSGGSLADWVASYDVSWACLPYEYGQYRTTIAANGSTALAITDEGTTTSYGAAPVGASPHSVTGFSIDGPVGSRYREDFNWNLLGNGDFSEFSTYQFFEGQRNGAGGVCASIARRS